MSIRKRLFIVSVILMALYLSVQAIVFIAADRQLVGNASDLKNELNQRDSTRMQEEITALAGAIEVFLTKEEDNLDDSMYHAALVLQYLDTISELTLNDLQALSNKLRVDDLYLTDMNGNFTLSTVPEAAGGIGLFEIWDGYRMLVTGEAAELPSAIKVMAETGEIYKFTALPRYDKNGNIKGVLESALDVGAIEKSMSDMISKYDMVNSFHLFEENGLTLLSVEKPVARESFVKGGTFPSADISGAFSSTSPVFKTPDDGSIVFYQAVNRFGGPAYVMRLEMEEAYFNASTAHTGDMMETLQRHALSNLLLIAGVGFAGIFLITGSYLLLVYRSVLKPIGHLQAIVSRITDGDISQVDALGSKDELGALEREISDMVDSIGRQAGVLNRLADGDYTVEISARSNHDVMNQTIGRVIDITNDTLFQITASAHQVSAGSKQIADGSQTLAQGSTQQASAVEQLSAAISEIAQKTKDNADMAKRAASLADTIKENAEMGSRQMDEMMEAVKEINQAGQNINKVIGVIDSIAFQTNILALNAAVEAARAGQHGKGFAVVAEEVRSLASKSADAAAETGVLISNSIEKAEMGSRIAGETAVSLAKIVSGIYESSQIITEIATSSEQQSVGIAQINHGIDQVAHVIQQNSATAQESAATSEEMSGQAEILDNLTSKFRLKGGDSRQWISANINVMGKY